MKDFVGALGFKNLDPTTAERLQDLAAETIMNQALVQIATLAGPQIAEQATALLETEQYEAFEQLMARHHIAFDQVVADAASEFEQTLQLSGQVIRGER